MTNRSKAVGTAGESAVAGFFRENGWPGCERRALHGNTDLGDLTGIPGLVVEVKAGEAARRAINQPALIASWLAETEQERRNARADIGVLVIVRGGFGVRNVGKWWAVIPHRLIADLGRGRAITAGYPAWIAPCFMELASLLPLLRVAGYGTPLEESQVTTPEEADDEFAEFDTTPEEFDAMMARGIPVRLVGSPRVTIRGCRIEPPIAEAES